LLTSKELSLTAPPYVNKIPEPYYLFPSNTTNTMNQEISGSSQLDKKIHSEQFDQVVEAIIAGKYSWACVLMLRVFGYNPLHYIPYRTYNRLIKENSHLNRTCVQHNETLKIATQQARSQRSDRHLTPNHISKIKDIAYLEVAGKQKTDAHGKNREQRLA
jgi:hypothetical protein